MKKKTYFPSSCSSYSLHIKIQFNVVSKQRRMCRCVYIRNSLLIQYMHTSPLSTVCVFSMCVNMLAAKKFTYTELKCDMKLFITYMRAYTICFTNEITGKGNTQSVIPKSIKLSKPNIYIYI